MAIKKIKLPGSATAIDIGVDWANVSGKPDLVTSDSLTAAINAAFATNDAMVFKGTIGTGGTVTQLPATHEAGWTYKVISNDSFAGQTCEIGDMIICIKDGTVTNTADWTVIQTNIDGAVTGPTSSTAGHIATFTGTTGKVIQDSGFTIATSVPANAVFTDTTYENKAAASDGTDVSLVTTGDKYNWNNKGTYSKPSGGIPASDLASGVIPIVPSAYTSNPKMNGTASAGSSTNWSKGDHVHPVDTSRQAKITASGILKGNGSGGVSAATAGTDYATPAQVNAKYTKPSGGIPDSDIASASTWNGKAASSTALSLTLASGSWSSATPPTQSLTAAGVTASNHILVGVANTITSVQYDAACSAKLICTAQGANSITITAYGDKPNENIPITVIILG